MCVCTYGLSAHTHTGPAEVVSVTAHQHCTSRDIYCQFLLFFSHLNINKTKSIYTNRLLKSSCFQWAHIKRDEENRSATIQMLHFWSLTNPWEGQKPDYQHYEQRESCSATKTKLITLNALYLFHNTIDKVIFLHYRTPVMRHLRCRRDISSRPGCIESVKAKESECSQRQQEEATKVTEPPPAFHHLISKFFHCQLIQCRWDKRAHTHYSSKADDRWRQPEGVRLSMKGNYWLLQLQPVSLFDRIQWRRSGLLWNSPVSVGVCAWGHSQRMGCVEFIRSSFTHTLKVWWVRGYFNPSPTFQWQS